MFTKTIENEINEMKKIQKKQRDIKTKIDLLLKKIQETKEKERKEKITEKLNQFQS